jgi:hypothetical protein
MRNFDRHDSIKLFVMGFPDFTESPRPDFVHESEMANRFHRCVAGGWAAYEMKRPLAMRATNVLQ